MISVRDCLTGLIETFHLMRSPANVKALDDAIADVAAGRVTEFDPTKMD